MGHGAGNKGKGQAATCPPAIICFPAPIDIGLWPSATPEQDDDVMEAQAADGQYDDFPCPGAQ